jgi:hypothetical protein
MCRVITYKLRKSAFIKRCMTRQQSATHQRTGAISDERSHLRSAGKLQVPTQ